MGGSVCGSVCVGVGGYVYTRGSKLMLEKTSIGSELARKRREVSERILYFTFGFWGGSAKKSPNWNAVRTLLFPRKSVHAPPLKDPAV